MGDDGGQRRSHGEGVLETLRGGDRESGCLILNPGWDSVSSVISSEEGLEQEGRARTETGSRGVWREKTRALKQALRQERCTGRTRLI